MPAGRPTARRITGGGWAWGLFAALALGLGVAPRGHAALPPARDTSFQTVGMDGLPNASVLLPDGKILIGGNFQNIGGVPRPALARLNADGTLDASFAPPVGGIGAYGKGTVTELAVQADGKIIAAGWASFRTTGVVRTNIIRFNADGSVDPSFDVGGLAHLHGLALQSDGKLVVAIASTTLGFLPVRLNADGSQDGGFAYSGGYFPSLQPLQFAAQAGGFILGLAGDSDPNRNGNQQLYRLQANGANDATFKFVSPPNNVVDDTRFAVRDDGQILVTIYEDVSSRTVPVVTRIGPDGTRDTSFKWSGTPNNQGLYPVGAAFLPDGGAIAVRQPTAGDRRLSFFYLSPTGTLTGSRDLANSAYDNGIVGVGVLAARAFAVQPDGKLLFAAAFVDGFQNVFGMFRMPPPPVPAPATITQQPADQALGAGDFLTLTVLATSESPMTYRWFHAGTNVAFQTSTTLSLGGSSDERAGEFYAVVDNAFGSVTSRVATVTVRLPAPPVITVQPQGGVARLSERFTLFAQVQSEVTTGFQWYKNGAALTYPGATGQAFGSVSLVLGANDAERAGDYFVVVTNTFGGSITSQVAHLDLIFPGPPRITAEPSDQAIFASQPARLSVTAIGDGVPQYRWQHEGTNLVAGAYIPSVTQAALTIDPREPNRFGTFSVVVTLIPGGSTTSRVATVTLLPSGPPQLVLQPEAKSLGLGERGQLDAAFNGEAPITFSWWHAGTNLTTQTFTLVDGPTTNSWSLLGVPNVAGDYQFIATNKFGAVTSRVASVTVRPGTPAEIRQDLADQIVEIGQFNTTALASGLVVTNCCGNLETGHVLALTPVSGIAPFPSEGTWHLGVGISNRFYVGAQSGFATTSGTWGYVPGAAGFTGLFLTNFPQAGNISRLETFDDGRYGIGLVGSATAMQSGHFFVLGPRRPATNTLSFDVYSSNLVSVAWYRDGEPINGPRPGGGTIVASSEGVGAAPAGGVYNHYRLTLGDVTPKDAGQYWAVVTTTIRNPDPRGTPAFITGASSTSRVATVTVHGYAATNAPAVSAAAVLGSATAMEEPTAMAVGADDTTWLAIRTTTFGSRGSVQSAVSVVNSAGEVLRSAVQASEQLSGGELGTIRGLAPDGDGGAWIAGDGGAGNLEPWFLRRIRPATTLVGGQPVATFTNLWTSRTAGPFSNGLQNLSVPHAATVSGLVRVADGVVVAGQFTGRPRFGSINVVTNPALPFFTAAVGGLTLTNAYDATFGRYDGSTDLYAAKFDLNGQLLWVRGFGGTNNDTLTSVAVDASGQVYLGGAFKGPAVFGGITLDSTKHGTVPTSPLSAQDGFVLKLDAQGEPVWARNFGGLREAFAADTTVSAITADATGGVYFSANRSASGVVLRPGMTVNQHYLARLSPAGELLWAQDLNSQGNTRLALDPQGNAVLADTVFGSAQLSSAIFGAATVELRPWTGTLVAKVDPRGTLLWARALDEKVAYVDDARTATAQWLAVDARGETIVSGKLPGGTGSGVTRSSGQAFDGFELTTTNLAQNNPTDVFLARLAPAYVPAAPVFAVAPVAQTALLQDRVVLEGRATGTPPPTYQWYRDGVAIPGANSRIYILPEVARTNRGAYTLVASNALGVVTSAPVTLTVQPRPNMTGWTLVTSSTNYLGTPTRVAADDAGRFYVTRIETGNGGANPLDAFHPDGTHAWRFPETVPGTFPVQDYSYFSDPRFGPVVTPSGALFIAGRYAIRRLQGAGSSSAFVGRVNPDDGTFLWVVTDLAPASVMLAGVDVSPAGEVIVVLKDQSTRRYDADGHLLSSGTFANLPTTVDPANARLQPLRGGGFYFYGNRVEALALGTTNLPALGVVPGAQNFVLARYDATGTLEWSRNFTGAGPGVVDPFRLLVTASGEAVVAGSFGVGNQTSYRFQFGTNLLDGFGYVARVSTAGDVRWARSWFLHIDDAVLGPNEEVVLGGWFRTALAGAAGSRYVEFGTNHVGAAYTHDTFVAAVDAEGHERFIRHTGSPAFATYDNAKDYSVAVNGAGTIWTAGFSLESPAAAGLDFGDLRYDWPDLRPYNIGNLFGDLPSSYIARLEVETAPPVTAEITWTPPVAGSTSLRLAWPTGYQLQYRATLYTGDWQTLPVTPPYDADLRATLQGYFRVVKAP